MSAKTLFLHHSREAPDIEDRYAQACYDTQRIDIFITVLVFYRPIVRRFLTPL